MLSTSKWNSEETLRDEDLPASILFRITAVNEFLYQEITFITFIIQTRIWWPGYKADVLASQVYSVSTKHYLTTDAMRMFRIRLNRKYEERVLGFRVRHWSREGRVPDLVAVTTRCAEQSVTKFSRTVYFTRNVSVSNLFVAYRGVIRPVVAQHAMFKIPETKELIRYGGV